MATKKKVIEKKPYRKYPVCQKCGKEFTTEHHFAQFCFDCKPPKDKVRYGTRVLEKDEYRVSYLEYFISVKCKHCNREIDIIWNRTQPHEMVCPVCKRKYTPTLVVEEYTDNSVTVV